MTTKFSLIHFSMSSYAEWVGGKANRNYHVFSLLRRNPAVGTILSIDLLPHSWKKGLRILKDLYSKAPYGKVVQRGLLSRLIRVDDRLFVYQTVEPLLSEQLFVKKLKNLVRNLGMHHCVVWSYIPTFVWFLKNLGESVTVFDTVDDWASHPAYRRMRERIMGNYHTIGKKADVIFTVSDPLRQKYYQGNSHAFTIANGVDLAHFSTPQAEPKDMKAIPHPRVCYVGVIQQRVDFHMVYEAAVRLPRVHFVFVGPVWDDADTQEVKSQGNVHFLGAKKYDQLPGYIQHADLGIIPHHLNELVKSMNPLKLYEYLASGKRVVSTPVPGTEAFSKNCITFVRNGQELAEAITAVVSGHQDISPQELQDAVAPLSWKRKVDTMIEKVLAVFE